MFRGRVDKAGAMKKLWGTQEARVRRGVGSMR